MTSLRERLLSKAVINWETGCWEWTASGDSKGYGRIKVGGKYGRHVRVHRLSYEMTYGPIPDGLQLDHLCRVRSCLNPAHLEPVTPRENILRGLPHRSGRNSKTHCKNGHEFTPETTYIQPSGYRACRACQRMRDVGRKR